MSIVSDSAHLGHRERLREQFANSPQTLSELEYLELLLTYAIPRMDVRPIARDLLEQFGDLDGVLSANSGELKQIKGVGNSAIFFLNLIDMVANRMNKNKSEETQALLFPDNKVLLTKKPREIRVFGNDEIANSLEHLPAAGRCESYEAYKTYLNNNLPYNSLETRQRRTSYILERFYPGGDLNTALTFFTKHNNTSDALKPVVFYHLAKAELVLAKVAEDLFYPALPLGKVGRAQLKEYVTSLMPEIRSTSLEKVLRSVTYSYELLNVGRVDKEQIKFQLRQGSLDALLYILISEFPEPGIYSFDNLFDGPAHHWLLWDKEWIRNQLYVLRDMGLVSKVSEIDTVKQFSLEFGQQEFLTRYYQNSLNKSGRDTGL
ncbi:MAG: UPF0758 domain-containing protein [Chloroflexota bacterium]